MAETLQEIIDKLPTSDELLKRCIQSLRRRKPPNGERILDPKPLWSRVGDMTANGSGYSTAICVKYGFDPDETWRVD